MEAIKADGMEMSTQTNAVLAPYVARARKVLQFEQRANHQDTVVKPGGLELFVVRWVEETRTVCKSAGLDLAPIHRFAEHLEGYRRQDPMQRASSLRAALAILDSLDGSGQRSESTPPTPSTLATLHTQTTASISSKPTATEKPAPKTAAKPSPAA